MTEASTKFEFSEADGWDKCPFNYDSCECHHPLAVGRCPGKKVNFHGGPPPPDCPLRAATMLVVLKTGGSA